MESTLGVEANMEIQQCLNTLYQQDALKLHRMVDKMLVKYGGISQKDKDDFYSIANQTITEIITAIENPDVERKYDSTKGNFLGYIYKAIHLAIIDNIKYRNASKRSVRVTDEDGEIQYLQPVSLEAPIDEGESLTVGDFLCAQEDGFEILQAIGEDSCLLDEHISRFLDSLTALQKQIVRQIMSGDTASEIQVQLSLTKAQYDVQMREIKSYEHTKFLHRRVVNKVITTAKETSRKDDRYMSISTTAEKTKDTHFSVASMRKKLHTREWREDHVLQRHADLWNQVAKSELIVDIISGKSLTQIIVSEEIRDGIYYRWLIDGKQRCTNIDDYCNGGFAISKKVQRPILEYQVTCTTEDGEIKYDKNGCPIYETRTFDIRGKRFNQLPDELKDKIMDYQIPVMLNLNCDKKEIAYDIARFNRCKPMNKSQNGWTGMDEDDAMLIDSIIRNTQFFKSDFAGSNFPTTQEKSGAIRKIVTESIMIINYLISDIITMLTPLGVTYKMIRKLLDDIPNPALLKQQLEQNPYILVRIRGLGFKRIDELALKLKPELLDSHERLVAFVKYFFVELGEEGHTWCSKSILYDAISNNVAECLDKFNWLLGNEDFLHLHGDKIGLKSYHDIELQIFHLLSQKSEQVTDINISEEQIQQAIQVAEKQQGFQYVQEQLDVIHGSLNRPLSVITGKAGTGKSTIMRAILCAYTRNKYTITASALSAMAAQRITEATEFPAMTIHRTLGCQGINKFTFCKDNKLLTNVAFLDEGSMVNASLFLAWLEAIDDNTRIIICGDHKQLPPIGYGNVFSDIIDKLDKSCVSQLTKPMRQAEQSGILVDANIIRENKNPIQHPQNRIIHGELKDMYYMFRTNRQSLFDIAIKTFLESVKTDGLKNVVLAVPRKQGCLNSTFELNQVLQDKLLNDEIQTISNARIDFKLGAKVMQTVNDYDKNVFNGEIGYITCIDSYMDKGKKKEYCEITYTDVDVEDVMRITPNCMPIVGSTGLLTRLALLDNTVNAWVMQC